LDLRGSPTRRGSCRSRTGSACERRRVLTAPRLVAGFFALLFGVSLAGCPGDLENPERFSDTGAACRTPIDVPSVIFTRSCTSELCHGSTDEPAGGLDLEADNVLDRLIDVPSSQQGCEEWLRIDSEQPEQSLLLHKLENAFPECGEQMPVGDELPRGELACIRDWIFRIVGKDDAGAPDGDSAVDDGSSPADAAE
jgi:hypothetical protein